MPTCCWMALTNCSNSSQLRQTQKFTRYRRARVERVVPRAALVPGFGLCFEADRPFVTQLGVRYAFGPPP